VHCVLNGGSNVILDKYCEEQSVLVVLTKIQFETMFICVEILSVLCCYFELPVLSVLDEGGAIVRVIFFLRLRNCLNGR